MHYVCVVNHKLSTLQSFKRQAANEAWLTDRVPTWSSNFVDASVECVCEVTEGWEDCETGEDTCHPVERDDCDCIAAHIEHVQLCHPLIIMMMTMTMFRKYWGELFHSVGGDTGIGTVRGHDGHRPLLTRGSVFCSRKIFEMLDANSCRLVYPERQCRRKRSPIANYWKHCSPIKLHVLRRHMLRAREVCACD